MNAEDSFSLTETAKMLDIFGFGRNRLIRFLREEGILQANNVAKKCYVDRGYFRVIRVRYYTDGGALRVKRETRVREKGVRYIRQRLDAYLRNFMDNAMMRY